MMLFQEFWVGLLTSFLGSLPIGIISVLVMQLAVHHSVRAGISAALGICIVEFVQVFVAVYCISLFITYPFLKTAISVVGIPVFLFLAYKHLRSDGMVKTNVEESQQSPFVQGLIISSLNMIAIPYWILWGGVFIDQGVLEVHYLDFGIFSLGSMFGTFAAMLLYIFVGVAMRNQLQKYNRAVNRFLGCMFIGFALLQLYKLLLNC